MPILKSEIRNKFTTIPNSIIQENTLSDGDFRLLIFLYSLPDKWKINQGYLAQKMNCNRRNVNSKIHRIKEAGYLDIIRSNPNTKNTDYIYVLKERDVSVDDVSVSDVSVSDVSLDDTYINNNIINTKEINNKLNKEVEEEIKEEKLSTTDLFKFIEDSFGRTISPIEYEYIQNWKDDELTRYAIKQAVLARAFNVKYIDKILFNYLKDGIKTVAEAEERDRKFQESKTTKSTYKTLAEKNKEHREQFLKEMEAKENELSRS